MIPISGTIPAGDSGNPGLRTFGSRRRAGIAWPRPFPGLGRHSSGPGPAGHGRQRLAPAARDYSGVPIIILTARGQEREKIANLDAGADDYLTKPFSMGELLARIRVALRRLSPTPNGATDQVVHFGNITLDFEKRQVWRGQEEVHLSPLEYKLLGELVKHHGKAVTHRQLLKEVWGPTFVEQNVYLRVFILNLRRKLEDDPARPTFLITEPGVGYRLKIE